MTGRTLILFEDESPNPATVEALARPLGAAAAIFRRADGEGNLLLAPDGETGADAPWRKATIHCTHGDLSDPSITHLFKVTIETPKGDGQELIDWYDQEHLPILLECGTWIAGQLVEEETAGTRRFHALHRLADPEALDSEARRRSRSTDWFNELSKKPWFDGPFVRRLFEKVQA
ncbi:MAG: hypothetical protein AB7U38_15260 [Hyphomicrobiales bacterium]